MKKTLTLLAIVVMIAFVFTGCGEKDDGTTVFTGTGNGVTVTFTFYPDGTWSEIQNGTSTVVGVTFSDLTNSRGTYTGGNPRNDCVLSLVITHAADTSWGPQRGAVLTNENCPLVDVSRSRVTFEAIITGNTMSLQGVTLTRQ